MDFLSYLYLKIGLRGWFFVGNDLSFFFVIMFLIIVLYLIYKIIFFLKIYYWILIIFVMYVSIMVGMKVGYGVIVIILGVVFFFLFIEYMINCKKEGKGFIYIVNIVVVVVILGGLIVFILYIFIVKNMGIYM